MEDIDKFFVEVRKKKKEDKEKGDQEKREKEEMAKTQVNNSFLERDNQTRLNTQSDKKGSAVFKSVSRE